MSYLIQQIFWCLLAAFVAGFVLGWLLRRLACKNELEELRRDLSVVEKPPVPEPQDPIMPGFPVEDIEGIGKGYGSRLREHGIKTTDALLNTYLSAGGRIRISNACGIEAGTADAWATMADLLRVPGVGGQWAELLWRCGVHDVAALGRQDVGDLIEKMERVNTDEHRVHELPGRHRVEHWVETAKQLPVALQRS